MSLSAMKAIINVMLDDYADQKRERLGELSRENMKLQEENEKLKLENNELKKEIEKIKKETGELSHEK